MKIQTQDLPSWKKTEMLASYLWYKNASDLPHALYPLLRDLQGD